MQLFRRSYFSPSQKCAFYYNKYQSFCQSYLVFFNNLRTAYPFLIYTLPVGGLIIVALYRGCRLTADKGTNAVIKAIHEGTELPLRHIL